MSGLAFYDDQVNELIEAFRRAHWTNQEVRRLCEGNILADVRRVLLSQASIAAIEHIIDCDAEPFVPDGWGVEEHQKTGLFTWDISRVDFYLSTLQKEGGGIEGHEFREGLAGKPVLNANVLDYLLKNPGLIPDSPYYLLFFGTIYRDPGGGRYVRYLHRNGGRCRSGSIWLGLRLKNLDSAVLRVS